MIGFDDYQKIAAQTDIKSRDDSSGVVIHLLGMAGEVGSLLAEYKKYLRDGSSHLRFSEQVAEELGDLLWYLTAVANRFDLRLSEIASENLEKVKSRWANVVSGPGYRLFDESYPESEQLPRSFVAEFQESLEGDNVRVITTLNGAIIGNSLTDNSHTDDGYRFHDVFHLSCAAVLGWSPILRRLLDRKRRSVPSVKEVEDGARAAIIDELVSQLVFTYAASHKFLDGIGRLDYHFLKTIKALVADREVSSRSVAEWESAILQGYEAWRQVRNQREITSAFGKSSQAEAGRCVVELWQEGVEANGVVVEEGLAGLDPFLV